MRMKSERNRFPLVVRSFVRSLATYCCVQLALKSLLINHHYRCAVRCVCAKKKKKNTTHYVKRHLPQTGWRWPLIVTFSSGRGRCVHICLCFVPARWDVPAQIRVVRFTWGRRLFPSDSRGPVRVRRWILGVPGDGQWFYHTRCAYKSAGTTCSQR